MAPTAPLTALYAIFLALPPALCHMQLSWPYPLHSKYNPSTPEALIDYSMTSPLDASGSNFPCKNYHLTAGYTPVATYTAGSRYNISLEGSATHLGGSCQLSLSYDEGKTFKIIKSIIGGCLLTSSYDFTVPEFMPEGNALFAWTWQNREGNREFYMNCAQVEIETAGSKKEKRAGAKSIDDLPNLWVADLIGVNGCTTAEGEDPVYPEPGPEVEYGGKMDGSSPATVGDCEVPKRNADSAPSDSYGSASVATSPAVAPYEDAPEIASATASVTASATLAQYTTATISSSISHTAGNAMNRFGAGQEASTTTITIDCPDIITMTLYPTATYPPPDVYTTSAPPSACTGTSAACPCAPGYDCRSIGTCTWACIVQDMSTSATGFVTATTLPATSPSSAVAVTTMTTPSPTPQPKSYVLPPSYNPSNPTYATGDLTAYLPCVPGTFICTSATEFYTCDYNDGSVPFKGREDWVYDYPRQVAAGMECMPKVSRYDGSTEQYAQQGMVEQGWYRDDQYVRAGGGRRARR
nr:hypothetical protein B0A51_16803 [Rachicladosporium sp. CCFEE 5018]